MCTNLQTSSSLLLWCECCCRSSKLWSFYADLEESLGTLESACAVYNSMLDLKVATPQIILNYALMLQVEAMHMLHLQLSCCSSGLHGLMHPVQTVPWQAEAIPNQVPFWLMAPPAHQVPREHEANIPA